LYISLLILSPPPVVPLPSEKLYLSALNPKTPQPLPSLHDAPSVDLSIIIPAFNEVARLPSMLETTLAHLKSPKYSARTYEILIIDDESSDGTSAHAIEWARGRKGGDEFRVVRLEANLGKGGGVRHGMMHARGRRLLMVDADGASRFEDLELLWAEMERIAPGDGDEPGVVVGSRAHLVDTEAVVKRSFIRNVAMYGLHTVLRLVGVGHIRDTQCGFKLFTRTAAQQIFPYQHLTGWIFDVEILLIAKQLDIPVREVPITWHEVPQSKLKLARDSALMFRDLMLLRANMAFGLWDARKTRRKME
ncbi:Alg5-prov protein, partial [Rickenella mellea]